MYIIFDLITFDIHYIIYHNYQVFTIVVYFQMQFVPVICEAEFSAVILLFSIFSMT